jgi:hypothetical protein
LRRIAFWAIANVAAVVAAAAIGALDLAPFAVTFVLCLVIFGLLRWPAFSLERFIARRGHGRLIFRTYLFAGTAALLLTLVPVIGGGTAIDITANFVFFCFLSSPLALGVVALRIRNRLP